MGMQFSPERGRRIRLLKDGDLGKGPVVYWMSREQRAEDNWGLLAAQEAAQILGRRLLVLFCFAPCFSQARARHYSFCAAGLAETAESLKLLNIPMLFLHGEPGEEISRATGALEAALVVSDFDPFPLKQSWKKRLLALVSVPVYEADGHNVIPAWTVSTKKEWNAATFRRKVMPLLSAWLQNFPPLKREKEVPVIPHGLGLPLHEALYAVFHWGIHAVSTAWPAPGAISGLAVLRRFLSAGLNAYDVRRNDPCVQGTSGLSPWLHFGQIAPQRAALEAMREASSPSRDAFLEELVVRREIADNFCLYDSHAGTFEGLPAWGRRTLAQHARDPRPKIYSFSALEAAATEDPLWNAAQSNMTVTGKLHGWLRMYWAKKILEWSETPEEAFATTLTLNDRYELDGRDPNGITGVSWAIGGLHDRPWPERPIFGTIRSMTFRGAARKFHVKQYMESAEYASGDIPRF